MKGNMVNPHDELSEAVINAAIEIHRELGPGLLESAYEQCLCHELKIKGIPYEKQVYLPVRYKGIELDCGYRMDIFIRGNLVIELKTVETILPVHEAQLLTYLKLSGTKTGLLLNFFVPLLKNGIKRMVN
jgi:GxxExxY protein